MHGYSSALYSTHQFPNFIPIGVHPTTFSDWEKIDAVELSEGERLGKPREKVTSVDRMLEIINQSC